VKVAKRAVLRRADQRTTKRSTDWVDGVLFVHIMMIHERVMGMFAWFIARISPQVYVLFMYLIRMRPTV